jgi:hypothetical protein
MTPAEPKHGPGRPRTKNLSQVPNTTAKRGPGRPRKPVSTQTPSEGSSLLVPDLINKTDDLGFDDNPDRPTVNLKDKLTEKELRFLEIYMSGNYTIEKAMVAVGYNDLHPRYRYFLASKIIQKYESQAEDHRNIFREMGAGEVEVVSGLLNLAKTAKSEMVRLNAYSMIAKCLGLTKEIIEGAGGVTVIFEASPAQPGPPGAPPPPPGSPPQPAGLPISKKPLMITK